MSDTSPQGPLWNILRAVMGTRALPNRDLAQIVFGLPETDRVESALGDRIESAGSFFDRVPAGEDYVSGTILHDRDDEEAAAIQRGSIQTSCR